MSSEKTKLKFLKVMSTKNIPEANKLSWEKWKCWTCMTEHQILCILLLSDIFLQYSDLILTLNMTCLALPCSATICLFLPRVRITQNWAELSNKFLLSCLFEYFKCTCNTWDFSLRTFHYKERIVDNVYR